MLSIVGTYSNGYVKFDKDYTSDNPVKVIVTFLEDIETKNENRLLFEDFSFSKSQKSLEHYKGSFSDEVIEELRKSL